MRMLGVPPWNAEQAERWRARGHDPAGDAPKDVPLPLKRAIRRMGADSDTRLERHVWCHSARVTGMACAGPSAREPTRSTWADATRLSGPAQAEIQHADVCLRNPRAGCDYSGSPRAARGMTLGREPNRAWNTPAEHPSRRMCPRKCRRGHVDTPAYRARGQHPEAKWGRHPTATRHNGTRLPPRTPHRGRGNASGRPTWYAPTSPRARHHLPRRMPHQASGAAQGTAHGEAHGDDDPAQSGDAGQPPHRTAKRIPPH